MPLTVNSNWRGLSSSQGEYHNMHAVSCCSTTCANWWCSKRYELWSRRDKVFHRLQDNTCRNQTVLEERICPTVRYGSSNEPTELKFARTLLFLLFHTLKQFQDVVTTRSALYCSPFRMSPMKALAYELVLQLIRSNKEICAACNKLKTCIFLRFHILNSNSDSRI